MSQQQYPKVSVVMRSYNDIDLIRGTLESVLSQDYPNFELWNFDSTSSDGTLEIIKEYNDPQRIILNDSSSYNPGTILNDAMARTATDIVVFINSDATPERSDWLSCLIAPMLQDPSVGAVFGRQTSRSDCRALFVKDNERAFGDGTVAAQWAHFFSMANSAISRTAYQQTPFETRIQYSEDIDWSWRVKQAGFKVVYVAAAAAVHSHNYSLQQSYKRHFGEGKADAWIFRDQPLAADLFSCVVLPAGMEILRDVKWAIQTRSVDALIHSVPLRLVQKFARWRGFLEGKRCYDR